MKLRLLNIEVLDAKVIEDKLVLLVKLISEQDNESDTREDLVIYEWQYAQSMFLIIYRNVDTNEDIAINGRTYQRYTFDSCSLFICFRKYGIDYYR